MDFALHLDFYFFCPYACFWQLEAMCAWLGVQLAAEHALNMQRSLNGSPAPKIKGLHIKVESVNYELLFCSLS